MGRRFRGGELSLMMVARIDVFGGFFWNRNQGFSFDSARVRVYGSCSVTGLTLLLPRGVVSCRISYSLGARTLVYRKKYDISSLIFY
jgi:hypothetical protein